MKRDRCRSPRSAWPFRNSRAAARPAAPDGRSGAEDGFTLLELLVSVTLLGLISVIAFGGLRFGVRAWEAGETEAATAAELTTVQGFIQQQLGHAYPLVLAQDGMTPRIAFDGREDGVSFVAQLPAYRGLGGLHRIDLSAVEDGGRRRLVMSEGLVRPDQAAPEGDDERTVLMDDIGPIALAYFGVAAPGEEARWHATWQDMPYLPSLVRIGMTPETDAAAAWPELTVAPRIDIDAACLFDPAIWRCVQR